jgi:hypothetical protein
MVSEESTMDDQFMLGAWRRPRPEFARQVRERLDKQDLELAVIHEPRRAVRWLAYAATLFLAVGAFAFPSVRAGAAAFLDLFRVVNFAPVAIQPDRLKSLLDEHRELDLPHMLGEQVQILKEAGPPQEVTSAEAAGSVAGIHVRMPAWLPAGMAPDHFEVGGEHAMRVTVSAQKVNSILDAVGVDDLRVPPEADGQSATMNVPPIVRVTFRDPQQKRTVMLVQARQPQASFPAGADVTTLAEIALRVLGVERGEAHRFAQNVDWRTTLLVPVPSSVAQFRQINVQGSPGLLIEARERQGSPEDFHYKATAQVMWSSGGSVFVLTGNVRPEELFEIAQSVQ